MQKPYWLSISIMEYDKRVKGGTWKFPDFSKKCPICGGKNCAVRNGHYYRWVIDLITKVIIYILIARYRCRQKVLPPGKDRTFSLLPHVLAPYYRYTIDSIMFVCRKVIHEECSLTRLVDDIYNSFDPDAINFEERYIRRLMALFRQTIFKLKIFLSQNNQSQTFLDGQEGSKAGWHYLNDFRDDSGRHTGALGFSRFYHEKQALSSPIPHFLYGTASQFLTTHN